MNRKGRGQTKLAPQNEMLASRQTTTWFGLFNMLFGWTTLLFEPVRDARERDSCGSV
jgi:hypothetical protein